MSIFHFNLTCDGDGGGGDDVNHHHYDLVPCPFKLLYLSSNTIFIVKSSFLFSSLFFCCSRSCYSSSYLKKHKHSMIDGGLFVVILFITAAGFEILSLICGMMTSLYSPYPYSYLDIVMVVLFHHLSG